MTISRWSPTNFGPRSYVGGLYDYGPNWDNGQVPANGNTGVINQASVALLSETVDLVTLLGLPSSTSAQTSLLFQSSTVGTSAHLILDSQSGSAGVTLNAVFAFENDGTIDVVGPAVTVQASLATSFINRGTINFNDAGQLFATYGGLENDGTMTISNPFETYVTRSITGSGTVVVAPDQTIEVSGAFAAGQTLELTGDGQSHSSVVLDQASTFAGTIAGFSAGDNITVNGLNGTLRSVMFQQTSAQSGTLQITTTSVALSLKIAGTYQQSDFTTSSSASSVKIGVTQSANAIAHSDDVYRFFDTANGTHFYTSSVGERDAVINTRSDLAYEGVGLGSADPTSVGATPVYRFFDTAYGTHFYTASATERDTVIATRPDLSFEGPSFYAHATQQSGDSAVYRFVDTQNGTHFYTASAAEMSTIKATRADLSYEGISFYAPPPT